MANRRGTKPRPFRFAAAIVAILLSADLAAGEGGRVLDDFRDPSRWTATASDSVRASLEPVDAPGGRGLCLDYDFNGVSGYAVARRKIEIGYPPNYAFDFQLRGEGPPNNLEFKLADAGGDNVWWVRKPDFTMPAQWTPQSFKKRMVGFAWGPTADRELHKSAALELTISAGKGGGKGRACIAGLRLRELPVDDGSPLVGSLARRGDGWTYDLGRVRELGGAILRWQAGPAGFGYGVALSGDGKGWRDVREVHDSDGGEDYIALPESEARYLRIRPEAGAPPLAGIEVQPLAFAATPNDFLRQVASRAPRGEYPRGFVGEQPYWTLLGVDGGHEQGLIGEDGAIELARGGPSIEPFVVSGGRLVTWADVESTQSLQDGDLPIPTVHWKHRDFGLDVTAFASGTPQRSQLVARYVLSNTTKQARDYVLALAARPFQVNPPSQFLSTPGGFSPIRKIFAREGVIGVDGPSIQSDQQSSAGIAATFDEGGIVQRLRNAKWSNACFDRTDTGSMGCDAFPRLRDTVDDPTGLASAALLYVIRLQPGESREIDWHSQLTGTPEQPPPPPPLSRAEDQAQTAAAWRRKLDAVRISLPPRAQPLVETLHTALAHILMSRDGPELRPGTRSYARSWIRDGAMMNDALLRLGRGDVAGAYVRWYAPYQFADGKVPCCVDARGSDPVPENDSQGELVHAIAQVYRYGRDRALLESQWPHVAGAVAYMDQLRSSERTEANRAKNAAFFGMMPASISHEGYSAKPMHSYWDDFWSLRGYDDAVEIARWLGRDADAARIAASRDQFRADLEASLRSATAQHGIGFLPGAAELGDFDPTSTTIALAPGDAQSWLPPDLLRNTFERYWTESVQRRDGKRVWKDYTPYELRTVGSFVRLGWRERANAMLDFFLAGQQPPGWRQWGEVVSSTPRKPFFLGDLPHAWVESDYIRSLLDMLAYERDGGRALVLAAGVPADWLASGIAVDGLRTPQGELHYALKRKGDALVWRIGAGMAPPAEGLILTWPLDTPPGETTVDGKPAQWKDGELRIDRLPAVVRARVH